MSLHPANRTTPAADEMAFGIVVVEQHKEIASLLLEGAVRAFREAGCPDMNLQIKSVPHLRNVPMATQFLAEYTDVDAVVVVATSLIGELKPETTQALLQQTLQVEMHWNMPCIWCVVEEATEQHLLALRDEGAVAAAEAIRMVRLQIDMEAQSPNATPDKRNLN